MTLTTIARRLVASLPPPVRWRTRQAIALARWWNGRGRAEAGEDTPYSDAFWALQRAGDWDGFARLLLRTCAPTSIVDVGCGDGKLLAAVRRQRPGMPVLGIDSSKAALARAADSGVPVAWHDLSSRRASDIAALRDEVRNFDLVVSLETAEHLPPWRGVAFVETLARGRMVLFSAAHPGQGGTLHLNERPLNYWRSRFANAGYIPSALGEAFVAELRGLDLPPWYPANAQLFVRHA